MITHLIATIPMILAAFAAGVYLSPLMRPASRYRGRHWAMA